MRSVQKGDLEMGRYQACEVSQRRRLARSLGPGNADGPAIMTCKYRPDHVFQKQGFSTLRGENPGPNPGLLGDHPAHQLGNSLLDELWGVVSLGFVPFVEPSVPQIAYS